MFEDLDEVAYAQGGPFSRQQAIQAGQTEVGFRRWRIHGKVRRLRPSVYVDATFAEMVEGDHVGRHALRAAATILRLGDEPAVSFESAALLWGVDTLGRKWTDEIQVSRARRGKGTRRYPGVVVHHAALPRDHVAVRHGVPTTTVARTVMDIARVRSFRAGVVAADCALREQLCTREDLLAVGKACVRWPGVRKARAVAEFADSRSESPLESISRAAFHQHDVPPPSLQEWASPYDRVDFLWKRERVIGEADGMVKYTDSEVLRREKERQEILERLGYRIVRWTWDEVFRRPDAVADWVRTALHQPHR